MVGGIFYWSLVILMHGVGVLGGLVGWWDFVLVVGDFDARWDGRMEIHPCVLQDIGPLGPLPKKDCKDGYTGSIGNMEPGDVEKFLFAVLNFK